MSSPRLLTALAVALAAPAAASAADLPVRQMVGAPILTPAPVASWAGFYAGTVYGIGHATFRSSQAGSSTIGVTGQTGGGLLGYNLQSGAVVYGLEGDLTMDVLRGHNPGTAGLVAHDVDNLHTSHLRARLGYDLGSVLPFITAGAAFNETYVYNGPTTADRGDVRSQTGLTLGAGLDWKFLAPFLGPMVLRAEYVYDNFGGRSYAADSAGDVRVRSSVQYARIGLISRFNDSWRAPASADVVDWSGAYGGLIGGGLSNKATTTLAGQTSTSLNATGAGFGIYAGRNFQFGNVVLGFDSASMLTNVTGSSTLPGGGSLSYRNYVQADIRGRVGYSFGRVLPFFAAGMAFGRSEQKDPVSGSERGRVPTETWTIGAGADYMLTDRVSLRGEYLYERTVKTRIVELDTNDYGQSRDAQTVRFGLAYHFH